MKVEQDPNVSSAAQAAVSYQQRHERGRAARDDDGHRPAEALERGKVKVIVVEVGDTSGSCGIG
jgi:hypothetical protein